jgi:hypothetical protein
MKELVKQVYEARRDRLAHPEGEFDSGGRWHPSEREDADGDGSCTRRPSRAWPYSYLLRCRTRQHCAALVQRGLAGLDVPPDVADAVRPQLTAVRPLPCELAGLCHDTPIGIVSDRLQEIA